MARWLFALLTIVAATAHADVVVIVNANSRITQLSREEVIDIFMGRSRKLPDGSPVRPLDIRPLDTRGEAPERRSFYLRLMDKSLAEINAYWARLIFSGRTMPPESMDTPQKVLERVARDPSAIGYVEGTRLNGQVRIVYRLQD